MSKFETALAYVRGNYRASTWVSKRPFSSLLGLTFTKIQAGDEYLVFETSCGRVFMMFHYQDCCESVFIESIVGELDDLLNAPILLSEEVVSHEDPKTMLTVPVYHEDSFTWTFYKLATIKGYADIRWYGESNGYYSESVDLMEVLE